MKKVKIKNRSAGFVGYTIPEFKDRINLHRQFQPNEVKEIDVDELEALTYTPGGETILKEYLQILDEDTLKEVNITVEPEYRLSEAEIKDIMLNGSQDAFLDLLDFAPEGVKDIVKKLAVSMPLNDMAKREAIKQELGYDVTKAIENLRTETEDDETVEEPKKERRVKPAAAGERRTTPSYKVIDKN